MKLKLKNGRLDLNLTKIAGILEVPADDPFFDPAHQAVKLHEAGAEVVELQGRAGDDPLRSAAAVQTALDRLSARQIRTAVRTSDPDLIRQAAAGGAVYIADPLALTAPGTCEAAAQSGMAVCIALPDSSTESVWTEGFAADPVAAATEFFFERIDACLNAGLQRRQLILDLTPPSRLSVAQRVSMVARIQSFDSFGLPLMLSMPEFGDDDGISDEQIAALTMMLFAASCHVGLIRTRRTAQLAVALGTWQLVAQKARPYRLSRGFIRRLRALKNALGLRKKPKQA